MSGSNSKDTQVVFIFFVLTISASALWLFHIDSPGSFCSYFVFCFWRDRGCAFLCAFVGFFCLLGAYFVYQEDFSRDANHGHSEEQSNDYNGCHSWEKLLLALFHDKVIAVIIICSSFSQEELVPERIAWSQFYCEQLAVAGILKRG